MGSVPPMETRHRPLKSTRSSDGHVPCDTRSTRNTSAFCSCVEAWSQRPDVHDRVRLNTNTMVLVHLQGFCSFAALAEHRLRLRPSSVIYDVYTMGSSAVRQRTDSIYAFLSDQAVHTDSYPASTAPLCHGHSAQPSTTTAHRQQRKRTRISAAHGETGFKTT